MCIYLQDFASYIANGSKSWLHLLALKWMEQRFQRYAIIRGG